MELTFLTGKGGIMPAPRKSVSPYASLVHLGGGATPIVTRDPPGLGRPVRVRRRKPWTAHRRFNRQRSSPSAETSMSRSIQILQELLSPDELAVLADRVKQAVEPLPAMGAQKPFITALTDGRHYSQSERVVLEAATALQTLRERRDVLAGALPVRDVAKLLGKTRQAIHDRVKKNTLLGINDGGQLRLPAWQFDAGSPKDVTPGLPQVLDILTDLHVPPIVKAAWLQRPNPYFEGRTPLDVLKSGDVERVLAEARGIKMV